MRIERLVELTSAEQQFADLVVNLSRGHQELDVVWIGHQQRIQNLQRLAEFLFGFGQLSKPHEDRTGSLMRIVQRAGHLCSDPRDTVKEFARGNVFEPRSGGGV